MYQPLENETTGPPAVMPEKRDDRRDNQLKPDDGSRASSITATATPDKPRAKIMRLGVAIKLSTVLSLASLVSLALAFAFISWLWWIPHEDPRWRRWVLVPNRLQLSVNVASLVIRTAIGTLAASATAMIASVAVERYGVRLHAVAPVSIARFASNGSTFLAALALRDSVSDYFPRIILLLLALTTIASQFTSTLLVADFQRSHIISFPRPASGAYCATTDGSRNNIVLENHLPSDYWREKPQLSETYAEYTETGLTADGIDDTGVAIRAFLPFMSPETRETLRTFEGIATVLNSRITCVRPMLSDLRLVYNASSQPPTFSILGTAEIDDLAVKAVLGVNPDTRELGEFECPITNLRYWQICAFRPGSWANVEDPLANYSQPTNIFWGAGNLVNWLDRWQRVRGFYKILEHSILRDSNLTLNNFKLPIHNSTKSGSWTQLHLDADGFSNKVRQIEKDNIIWSLGLRLERQGFEPSEIQKIQNEITMGRLDDAERLIRQRISEEVEIIQWTWKTLKGFDSLSREIKNGGRSVIGLRMTVCTEFDFGVVGASTGLNHVEIFASSIRPRTEPTYGLAADWEVYDTSVVRRQLGAISSPTTTDDRQIMFISPDILRSSLDKLHGLRNNNETSMDEQEIDTLLKSWFIGANSDLEEIRTDLEGNSFSLNVINQVYYDLLDATINETDSPARALQAVYFSRYRKVYNDLINLIPPRDDCNLTVTTFEPATVPGRHRGYWAVAGISCVFLVCFAVVRVLFDATQSSLPDNAWHTIAQISESAEISAILSRSRTKTDKEVVEISQHLKDDDEEDRFVVRGGVFARASMWTADAKDDSGGDLAKTRTTGLRRRLMTQLRESRDGSEEGKT